jgi:hypothetical protein
MNTKRLEMQPSMTLLITVFYVLIIAISLLVIITRNMGEAFKRTKKHPIGHYMGLGIATGMPFGYAVSLPIGIGMENLAMGVSLGPAFGAGIGVFIGYFLEMRYKDELRDLLFEEIKTRNRIMVLVIAIILACVGGLIYIIHNHLYR